MVDNSAVSRQSGLGMMIGPLASIMGPDEDMAKPIMDAVTVMVCDECASNVNGVIIAALAEK